MVDYRDSVTRSGKTMFVLYRRRTPAPPGSGSAAGGTHLAKSGARMQRSLGRAVAAGEPIRWAAILEFVTGKKWEKQQE